MATTTKFLKLSSPTELNNFRNSSVECFYIRTVSADVTQPLQAKQSESDTFAV